MLVKIKNTIIDKYEVTMGVLILIMCTGYFFTYLRFAKPRGFEGDFYAAMYDPNWWDGNGIFYGPIFVFERWIVNAFPSVATPPVFAISCLILLAASLLIIIRVVHAGKAFTVFCVATWTFNSFFYYSFSVAANPELIELFFLVIMWWGLSTKRYNFAWFFLTCAVLTKIAPIVLAPILLLFFSWSALAISILTLVGVLTVVSIGQSQSIFSSISQIMSLKPVEPQPTSEQFLGLSSALARLFGIQAGGDFSSVLRFSLIIILILYVLAFSILLWIQKSNLHLEHEIKVAYVFSVFMCLLPLFHLGQTHRHTYLFLAPAFVAFMFVVKHDSNLTRSRAFKTAIYVEFLTYSLIPIYILDVYNFDNFGGIPFGQDFITSLLMLSEPVWLNIILFSTMLLYGIKFLKPSNAKI